jgi:hypothetical protein
LCRARSLLAFGEEVLTDDGIRYVLAKNRDSICRGTYEPRIGTWDVRGVHDMESLFDGWDDFNEPIGEWDTSNVTTMESMFNGCTSFDQPIGWWVTGNVATMESMFKGGTSFDQPLTEWDVSNVANMGSMFYGCTSFNQPLGWDTRWVNDMSRMFYGCTGLEQTLAFDMSGMLGASGMFGMCDNASLIAWDPSDEVVEQLMSDLGSERLQVNPIRPTLDSRSETKPKPVYTLGPNRSLCYDESSRAHIAVYETRESRLGPLTELREAVASERITGFRRLPSAYAWPLIFGPNSNVGGDLRGVSRAYILDHVNPVIDTGDALVVARRMGAQGAPRRGPLTRSRAKVERPVPPPPNAEITAFVRADVSDAPKELFIRPNAATVKMAHMSWLTSMAYVPLLVSSVDAPAGHAAEALAAALKLAMRSKQMLVLGSIKSAVLWYLNTCFLSDTHQVVLNTRESFEKTRAYALSDREGIDLERTLADVLIVSPEFDVAFVFGTGGATGREVLSGMDYDGLRYKRPSDLGRHVRMFRVSADTPLVKGCSYEYMRYPDARETHRGRGRRGYMYERDEDGSGHKRRYGRLHMAGEFVRLEGDVAVFKIGSERVPMQTAEVGFRRTFKSHAIDDSDAPATYIKVEPED